MSEKLVHLWKYKGKQKKEPIALVPVMTSETTPSGQVIKSGQSSATYAAWKAFDRTDAYWGAGTLSNAYIGYKFPSAVRVTSFTIDVVGVGVDGNTAPSLKDYKIQKSSDATNWTDIYTGTVPNDTTNAHIYVTGEISDTTSNMYYRLWCTDRYTSGSRWIWIRELQFYGYEE